MNTPDGTKRCSRCGETKPVSEFSIKNKKTGLLTAWCRECRRAYGREHYRANTAAYMSRARRRKPGDRVRARAIVAEYLRAHPCIDCGETDILLLDFDHRDASTKRAPVARLVSSGSISLVMAEIAKCDVRCGNCHRKRTAAQLNWRKSEAFQDTRRAPLAPLRRAPRASASGDPVIEQRRSGTSVSRSAAAIAEPLSRSTSSRSLIVCKGHGSSAVAPATLPRVAGTTWRTSPSTSPGRRAKCAVSATSSAHSCTRIFETILVSTAARLTSRYWSSITSTHPKRSATSLRS